MGKNMSGFVSLAVKGSRNSKVKIRHGEILNPDGTLYTENLRSARAADTYILKGEGNETFEPRFTFHGFRFIEVTGDYDSLEEDSIKGIVISSIKPVTGSFDSSNRLINSIMDCISWSMIDNFLEVRQIVPRGMKDLAGVWTAVFL